MTWWQAAIRFHRRTPDDFPSWWAYNAWVDRQIERAQRDSAVLGGIAVACLVLLVLAIIAVATLDLLGVPAP